jgi:nitronate monooxygenase
MNFNSGGNASAKVWKDIYGSGQGINAIKDSPKVADLVEQMKTEFQQARSEFSAKSNNY